MKNIFGEERRTSESGRSIQGETFLTSLGQGVMMDRHKTMIGVKGIGSGAGATFTAVNLAFWLADMTEGVIFKEGEKTAAGHRGVKELLSVDPKFRKATIIDGARLYKKITWFGNSFNNSEEEKKCDLNTTPGRYVIVDNPQEYDDLDILVAVVDPLPSRIEAGLDVYRQLRNLQTSGSLQIPVIWTLNKVNSQAFCREVETYLKLKFDFRQEMLPSEVFYKAEYSCTQQFFVQRPEAIEKVARRIMEHKW